MKSAPRCRFCGEPIPYEKRQNKFCSQSCAAVSIIEAWSGHGNKHGTVLCLHCGQPIVNAGKKFCGLRCSYARRADETEQRIRNAIPGTRVSAGTLRGYLIRTRGERCEVCGWDRKHPTTGRSPLEVDHVDGDATNHRLDNLRLLCPNCHSLTPTFRNLNKGNGRAYRRKAPH